MVLGYGAALSGHKLTSVNLCHLEQILCLPPETYYYKRRLGLVIQHNKLQHVANLENKRQPGKTRDNLEKNTKRQKHLAIDLNLWYLGTWKRTPEREKPTSPKIRDTGRRAHWTTVSRTRIKLARLYSCPDHLPIESRPPDWLGRRGELDHG